MSPSSQYFRCNFAHNLTFLMRELKLWTKFLSLLKLWQWFIFYAKKHRFWALSNGGFENWFQKCFLNLGLLCAQSYITKFLWICIWQKTSLGSWCGWITDKPMRCYFFVKLFRSNLGSVTKSKKLTIQWETFARGAICAQSAPHRLHSPVTGGQSENLVAEKLLWFPPLPTRPYWITLTLELESRISESLDHWITLTLELESRISESLDHWITLTPWTGPGLDYCAQPHMDILCSISSYKW